MCASANTPKFIYKSGRVAARQRTKDLCDRRTRVRAVRIYAATVQTLMLLLLLAGVAMVADRNIQTSLQRICERSQTSSSYKSSALRTCTTSRYETNHNITLPAQRRVHVHNDRACEPGIAFKCRRLGRDNMLLQPFERVVRNFAVRSPLNERNLQAFF